MPLITEEEHPEQIDIALLDADRTESAKKIPKDASKGVNKGRVVKPKARRILTKSAAQMEVINKEAFENNQPTEKDNPPTQQC